MMNVSILNALWVILVGEKLDLEDPKLDKLIVLFEEVNKSSAGPSSPLLAVLPHMSMAEWPILRQLTGFQLVHDSFWNTGDYIEPYIKEHQRSLDANNIRDFVDLALVEIQNTTDSMSSFYGKTGWL